jgi:hypothetical protein
MAASNPLNPAPARETAQQLDGAVLAMLKILEQLALDALR